MKTLTTLFLAITMLILPAAARAAVAGNAVEVEIRTDDGRSLPMYPAASRSANRRVYAEAVRGDRYRIKVRNLLNRRIGLVIAVDGRNIISGGKSWLKSDERMYVLEPYGSCEYSGWRTAEDRINRFYFTTVDDSYAASFKDESAMGVIAVAVYLEVVRYEPRPAYRGAMRDEATGSASKPFPAPPLAGDRAYRKAERMLNKAAPSAVLESAESAGTGYGREEYSPSYTVAFEPEAAPKEKLFIKYEWRETLCRLGVINCRMPRQPKNRLWDNGFCPPPPGRG